MLSSTFSIDTNVASSSAMHLNSLVCNLSILNHKLAQLQSIVSSSSSVTLVDSMATLIQEIIETASTMMFSCKQMALTTPTSKYNNLPSIYNDPNFYWYNNTENVTNSSNTKSVVLGKTNDNESCDIVEIEASDLLAKYTHYCQVCEKGFKRDANLRMHMRAHGEEYKSTVALINPLKNNTSTKQEVKYSCPQEGCRWNKNHEKFQPLKSMICVKNHYKRSHCPKMYVCKRCNRKKFSVLSDLRTHEKHCGDGIKWLCSCGSSFSRKDKLVGHVALFVGHEPVVSVNGSFGIVVENAST